MDSMIGTDGCGLKVADPLSRVGKALPVVGKTPRRHSSRWTSTS
jgi:hypothetical protein